MEIMRNKLTILVLLIVVLACKPKTKDVIESPELEIEKKQKSTKQIKEELIAKGFQIFDYVDEKTKDTIIMQHYFMTFLKTGSNRNQSKEEATKLQEAHIARLGKMYDGDMLIFLDLLEMMEKC